jgi:hypothetical protein
VKFKLDENLPVSAASVLAAAGHDVDTVSGEHGIVILRLADQSAATVTKALGDLASLAKPESRSGAVAVMQRGLLRIRHP